MHLALYEPDIPQNTGAMLRLAACFGLAVDIIEPCGFIFDEPRMRRAGMDYIDQVTMRRHAGWESFKTERREAGSRLILMTTKSSQPYFDFQFAPGDTLIMGRESAGVPDSVHETAEARLLIPMKQGCRSLNVAQAAAIVSAEAMRQSGAFLAGELDKAFSSLAR